MISCTGKGIRGFDGWGDGRYDAPRGTRKHRGIDLICDPGQDIVCPIGGFSGLVLVVRIARPHTRGEYSGLVLKAEHIVVKLFYLLPDKTLIGELIKQGDVIGIAQDISKKYFDPDKEPMIPHIHQEIVGFDAGYLLECP